MIYGISFSPTKTTEEIVKAISSVLSKDYKSLSLTSPSSREQDYEFTAEDTIVIGFPTYAGRIPNLTLPVFNHIKGNGAKAIAIVTYGCRAYEDSLLELTRLLRDCGFEIIGAAAFPTRHSFTNVLGTDRPNLKDLQKARDFSNAIANNYQLSIIHSQLKELLDEKRELRPYYIPKTDENDEAKKLRKEFLKAHPMVNPDKCTSCGTCIVSCPMGSIHINDNKLPEVTGVCIKCCACVRNCNFTAITFDAPSFLYHKHDLEAKYAENNPEPEFFV